MFLNIDTTTVIKSPDTLINPYFLHPNLTDILFGPMNDIFQIL